MANFQHHPVNLPPLVHPLRSGRPLSCHLEEPRLAPRDLFPKQVLLALRVPQLREAHITPLRPHPILQTIGHRILSYIGEDHLYNPVSVCNFDYSSHSRLLLQM